MKRLNSFFIFFSIFFYSFTTYAWDRLPHMVIASIAYQNLTSKAQTNVNQLVATLKNEYPDMTSYLRLGYWADEIRAEKVGAFSSWHFIDNAWSGDGTPIKNVITTDNAVWAIGVSETPIGNTALYPIDRARFLAFLTHIVGDIHQPLHSSTRFSAKFPNGDAGGTHYNIVYNGSSDGIHYFWDGGVTFFNSPDTEQNATQLANQIMQAYPPSYFGNKVNDLNPANWSQEGLAIAQSFVYTIPEGGTPTAAYIATGRQISQQRVALAGYRLAAVLNQLLG